MILVSLCPQTNKVFCAHVGEPSWWEMRPPQSLLKTPCTVFSKCCSAVAGVRAGGRMGAVVTWQQSGYLRLCCCGWHRRFCGHFSPAAAGFVLPAVSSAASTIMGGIAELTEKPWFPLSPKADRDRGLLKLKNSRQIASNAFTAQLFKIQLISLALPESLSSPMPSAKPVCLNVNEWMKVGKKERLLNLCFTGT